MLWALLERDTVSLTHFHHGLPKLPESSHASYILYLHANLARLTETKGMIPKLNTNAATSVLSATFRQEASASASIPDRLMDPQIEAE